MVHTEIVMRNGLFNFQLMPFDSLAVNRAYAFIFVFTPVPLNGALGSPVRPIAIR